MNKNAVARTCSNVEKFFLNNGIKIHILLDEHDKDQELWGIIRKSIEQESFSVVLDPPVLTPIFHVGQKLLTRSGPDGDRWEEIWVNDTYARLIKEYPEQYRHLDGSELKLTVM